MLAVALSLAACLGWRAGPIVARVESGSTSKGMSSVALVELGSGCCHAINPTKAAIRACNNAVEWNSIKVRTIIPGGYDAMLVHVHIACPSPELLNLAQVAACFPYGTLLPIEVEEGGMLGSSRAGLPRDEPPEAMMTVANACVTVGWGAADAWSQTTPAAADAAYPPPARPLAAATAAGGSGGSVASTAVEMTKRGDAGAAKNRRGSDAC